MYDLSFALLTGYLLGSIPTGVWIAAVSGIDVRRHGSRNTGATNVARVVGRGAGVVTLLGDALKGLLAVWLLRKLGHPESIVVAGGLAALFGHSYSVFLRFRGGKAVATTLGVFFLLSPWALLISLGTFAVVAWASRYVSLASMVAAGGLPIATLVLGYSGTVCLGAALAAGLILLRHRENLRWLFEGTEPRFGTSK